MCRVAIGAVFQMFLCGTFVALGYAFGKHVGKRASEQSPIAQAASFRPMTAAEYTACLNDCGNPLDFPPKPIAESHEGCGNQVEEQ